MLTDKDAAYMTMQEFDALPEYSCSVPTGTHPGKRWKKGSPYMKPRIYWTMGEYIDIGSVENVGIRWREIFIVQLSLDLKLYA